MINIVRDLCCLDGVSGREAEIREYIINRIKDKSEVTVDALGNIIAFVKGKNRAQKKVMLDAHMDEVGLIITAVTADGFLKFSTVGGINTSVLLARRVIINKSVYGVISMKPVHMVKGEEKTKIPEMDSLYIDIGANDRESALELVKPGDFAVFEGGYESLGDLVISKALDDRIGCAAIIDIIEKSAMYDFYATFTVQEEVGTRGAKTAAYTVNPDFAFVLESTTASDIAGVADDKKVCLVGNGAVISFMDNGTLYDRELFDMALDLAKEKNIKCQIKSYVSGGNNAASIHQSRGGVRTLAISVPCRYIHSASSVASEEDMLSVRNLAEAMLNLVASGE